MKEMSVQISKVRILIVGDSGVGKTCLTHLIAHNESMEDPGWTVGCNIEVKLHYYKENMQHQELHAVELFDIGGSLSHKNTRGVFYNTIHGIILVHDLTNRRSHDNLHEWLCGILAKDGKDTMKHGRSDTPLKMNKGKSESFSNNSNAFDPEEFCGTLHVPLLVVGTKLDLIESKDRPASVPKTGGIAEQCSADEIWLNCHDADCLSAGSADNIKITRFLDRVIESVVNSREINYCGSAKSVTERKRQYPSPGTFKATTNLSQMSLIDDRIST